MRVYRVPCIVCWRWKQLKIGLCWYVYISNPLIDSLQMMDSGCFRLVNTLRPTRNGRHFADDIFKCIFLYENVWIPIKISLKFVPKGPINNIPALVQIMAWRRPGDKPLSEPMMVRLPTQICVTRPQWVKAYQTSPRGVCKNTERHTAHTIVSWPSPKQWVIVHSSDLMIIIR